MKQLLITIAAVVLVGCGPSVPDISIHDAAKLGQIASVKQHLAAGVDVNFKDKSGRTPLFYAVKQRRTQTVVLLIEKGADVNATSMGETPLMQLSGAGLVKETEAIRKILNNHGAKNYSELKAEGK